MKQGFPTPQKDYYKVYVRSCTYNQAGYIEDCLNGVAMQETNFPFVHHVIDDASTDGEQEVIKAWMDKNCDMERAEYYDNDLCTIILVKNKKTPNCTLAVYLLKENWYQKRSKAMLYTPWREACPYEATCEGDDYWIDSNKLQKQFDYMESQPECYLCFSNAKVRNDEHLPCSFSQGIIEDKDYQPDEFFKTWCIPTGSVLYRSSLNNIVLIKPERIMYGDIVLYLKAAKVGKVHGMSDTMTVYRLNGGGVTQDPKREYATTMRRPDFVEFIIDNFGDILDKKFLYKGLCKRYCNRALLQPFGEERLRDFKKAATIDRSATIKFVLHSLIIGGLKIIIKLIQEK